MKYFTALAMTFIIWTTQAQSFRGSTSYGDSTLPYQIKIVKAEDAISTYFSSVPMNAFEIPCQNLTRTDDTLKFYVMSHYYTYEYKYLQDSMNYKGWLKVYSNETEQLLNTFETSLTRETEVASDGMERREITFTSNNLQLHGTLWQPINPIQKGLFFVTSSQGHDRSATNAEAYYFARLGYTVFNYDKRGTGKSEGDWQSATIEQLCSDDMNALEIFSKISSLPMGAIGIKGSSQGGIKIPYILSKMPDLGFGISVSCPGGTLLESDLNHWKNIHYEQIGKDQIDQALKVQKAGYGYLAGSISFDSLMKIKNSYGHQKWLEYVWIPEQDVNKDYKLNFSGLPYFEKITQPILVLQGLSDRVIPENSHLKIQKALKLAPTTQYDIVLLKNTSHSMMSRNDEIPYFQLLANDYLPQMTHWIKKITFK
ncbi:hypothetical protein CLV98_102258 [Dyadobacter jejuensis]|uniref:Xaa-Pro dipeptidyl-peptidase-like domain-containing protein n=1 Tax=Dyadobacter jejuensis TaxID=1082580 RepID=A0A316ANS6_9BACT|nr:CocE/NonD family hydrolase [Dyadobacter jejuensis]PWJ59425.1 hypothetical protein CLV98_102258 [Dyadobacter jejuensis]